MRGISHKKTLIATMLDHVNVWRKGRGWSRETVVQTIVEAHEATNAQALTDIRFEPKTTDQIARQKVNADKVFRWLDDATKDNNLLPANFIPSINDAMPMELKVGMWNEILNPSGLKVSAIAGMGGDGLNAMQHLLSLMKESNEALQAVASLVESGATQINLVRASCELTESLDATRQALMAIDSEINRHVGATA